MKIVVATRFAHMVGGVETYLAAVLPALAAHGHDVCVWHEFPLTGEGDQLVPRSMPLRMFGADRRARLAEIRAWRPDAIFLNGLSDPDLEVALGEIAPLVILLHAYHGSCISGTKTFGFPVPQVCSRALGPGCLVNYFPRRCGGLNPVRMVTSYQEQRRRQTLLRTCAAVTTLSEHMRQESIAQGVSPSRVHCLPAFASPAAYTARAAARSNAAPWHLLFIGRMESLKGGQVLLDAFDRLDATLRRRLFVTFIGDGRERQRWEEKAVRVSRGEFEIQFTGWLTPSRTRAALQTADLLVVPSVWPEPFGLVGLEAAAAEVPALAFDVGGIREWLTDGVTGRLVAASGEADAALARALEDCLSDPARLRTWGATAYAQSHSRTMTAHIEALEGVIARVAAGSSRADLQATVT